MVSMDDMCEVLNNWLKKILKELQVEISKAQVDMKRFLSISQPWSAVETQRFLGSVHHYHAKSREIYCDSTGYNRKWLKVSSPTKQCIQILLLTCFPVR